jgi:hypothetical protein
MKGGAVMLYVLKEWQGSSGLWYCEHTDSFPKDIQKWIIPARILGVTADEFIKILIKDFQPDKIFHNEDCSFVGWGWYDQSKMRKYKNYFNALSRKKNFQI